MHFDSLLLEQLRTAQSIVVFTGAGVSAESGVPTFRDAQTGLWAKFRAEDLATPEAFLRDPATVWSWYAWRREAIAAVQPNSAHHAIAELERRAPDVAVVTQNVDGLHSRAGSSNVIELHGNIGHDICFDCGRRADSLAHGTGLPPRCVQCGGLIRPGVVWFGEALPADAWNRAAELAHAADIFFCIGTSSLVEPAASLPQLALAGGAVVVQINPEATAHDAVAHHVLRGKAGVQLPALLGAAWPHA